MIYKKNDKVKYRGLSRDEIYLISRAEFEKRKFITTDFVRTVFNDSRKSANILDRLTRKGRFFQIEKGKYFIVPIKAPNQLWMPNEFVAAKFWIGEVPYYIGYFTMYNYWGFTSQVPQIVFVLNTKKSRVKIIGGIKYKAVKIKEDKYYGVKKITIDGENINISDKERTLVDFIFYPIGSFGNVGEVIKNNIKEIDLDKFIKYLNRFPVNAVRKRAGYILEELGYPKKLLEKIKKNIGKRGSYVVLNPGNPSRKGKVDKEWGVIING
jgi:predicted transcriptional regulator of viral defense system